MTITYKELLKLPSREFFLECLNNTNGLPFSIRARVVKAYRRMKQDGLPDIRWEIPFEFPQAVEYPDVLVEESTKTAKEKKLEKAKRRVAFSLSRRAKEGGPFDQNQGSRKNVKVRNSLKCVIRWTSRGKNRKTFKPKNHFVSVKYMLYLKGNQYSGGQDEF